MSEEVIITNFGRAKIKSDGYYKITSSKEGNGGRLLHRLIWEDWYNKPVPEGYVIHHINGDKTDNRIQNLQCVEDRLHRRFHKQSENHHMWSKHHSEDTKRKMSEAKNTTGYYRVSKLKDSRCKQGFLWRYSYYEDGQQKHITNVSLEKLEQKVRAKNLPWYKIGD